MECNCYVSSWPNTANLQHRDEAECEVARRDRRRCLLEMAVNYNDWNGHRDVRVPLDNRRADPNSAPQKTLDRHATLAGAQIINYRITPDEKWMVLIGISGNTTNPSAFKVKGAMQLYSKERGVSQPIEGHAAAFAELKLDGNQHPTKTKLFTFSVRTGAGAKVSRARQMPR